MTINIIPDKIKQVLSHPKAGLVVLLLALAGRLLQVLFFFNIRSDRSFQLMATDNFLNGHGISTAHVLARDLTTILYEPLIKWPPGYSLLVAPFYAVFGRNYMVAGLTLDILSAIAFVVLCRAIVKRLDLSLHLVNGLTLVAGLFIYSFYFISSTDTIAITLFLAGLYAAILLLKRGEGAVRYGLWIAGALLACALFKYVFLLAVFIIPLFLILKGFLDHQQVFKKAGYISISVLAAGLCILFLYQDAVSVKTEYISNVPTGIFPENLLSAYPFLPASFIKPDTVMMLTGMRWKSEVLLMRVYQGVYLVMSLVIIVVAVRAMYIKGLKKISITESFFHLSLFTSLAVVGLLALMSLRYGKHEELPGFWWTYIQEPRYYGLPIVLVHLSFFVWYQYLRIKRFRTPWFATVMLLLLLLVELLRGGVFTMNRVMNFGKEEYSWQHEDRFQKYAAKLIGEAKKKQSVSRVVIAASHYYFANRVALYSHVPILNDVDAINDLSGLGAKAPVLLLVMLHKDQMARFRSFLSQPGRAPVGIFEDYSFYTVYVAPH